MAKKASGPIYPLSALRATILHAQLLDQPNSAHLVPSRKVIVDLVKTLSFVQIDALQVVNRSHDVTLWSRLGRYDIDDFHKLIYTPDQRRLYEGWGHAASIIPLEHYRFHRWRIDRGISFNPAFRDWLSKKGNRELAEQTLARIRAEGALRVGDFETEGSKKGMWYDWKPPKMALEVLFARGDLMVADRVNFQRIYDIKERVLPGWVNTSPVDDIEGRRFCLEQAARALGIFKARNLTFYAYMRATPAQAIIKALIEEVVLVGIRGESMNGENDWMVHRDNLPLLQRAADGEVKAERTTFLSPFDSLFWAGDRDQELWGFKQMLECYKPAEKRVYGYFCFPILYKDRLVGRFDPKLDRKTGVMHLNALYLEPGIKPDDDLVAAIAAAMRDFLAWHGAKSFKVKKSDPPKFGKKLMGA